jgi:hypothetical protein
MTLPVWLIMKTACPPEYGKGFSWGPLRFVN